ncbi:RluA family pseudouridine synthase [candidate division WWE3 bacterium CG_4_9_14_0_2_um_filter_35_11]|uniref:Pseudouridine synthase n=1 Tax=candidate division WWE3 bacterium CG_4_9_14_0_2_um_filter_35_11 TaxID=1975077 RepID=A0A2M8EMT0_UNCKA|nr:MAG: RluA family pseudouridine synthase [candidate division WWE3 bacterium CG10_big_fil_rev_8_21_14_0_10_35_32]PJC24021.1 MAG: RluA family pseudouridine synthase [candidate division WWE3 bacterium CG_4_9_14_0_2_um_filter_35_11]
MKVNLQNNNQKDNLDLGLLKDIRVIFEDDDLVVLDKPTGLVINAAETQKDNVTLQDLIAISDLLEDDDTEYSEFKDRSGIVHRLDKDTSGIIIVAKNRVAFENLQDQFKSREVHKVYTTLVYGLIDDFKEGESLEIDAPIARNPKNRQRFAVVESGKPAVTKIKLMKIIKSKNDGDFSLLECYPRTGRTHQIRVHLTALGNAVVGDFLYSGRTRSKRDRHMFTRQFLHASKIEFKHPVSGEVLKLESKLPEDLTVMLDYLSN